MRSKPRPAHRILLSLLTNGSYGREVAEGFMEFARARTSWEIAYEGYAEERLILSSITSALNTWHPDAVLIQLRTRRVEELLIRSGVPAVNISGTFETKVPTVRVDFREAGAMAARHLMSKSLKRFAYCGIPRVLMSQELCEGFENTVNPAGQPCAVFGHDMIRWNALRYRQRLATWLADLPKPIGILACQDWIGRDVVWTCRRLGLSVPDEVAIVGVNNDLCECTLCEPPLSSVGVPARQIGHQAGVLLERIVRTHKTPRQPILFSPTDVIARQSSDMLAIDDPSVAAAIRFIKEQAHRPITVSDVLPVVTVSRRQLERDFARIVGRTLWEEMTRAHVEQAKKLLVETTLKMPDVCRESGFTRYSNFTKVFEAHVGTRPSEYRTRFALGFRPDRPEYVERGAARSRRLEKIKTTSGPSETRLGMDAAIVGVSLRNVGMHENAKHS